MTRTFLSAVLAAGLLPAAVLAEGRCTVSRDGTDVALEHVYAVRVPDPFAEGATRIRFLCVSASLDPEQIVSDEGVGGAGWHAVHRGERGLLVDLDAEARPVYTVIAHDGGSAQFSGPIWDVVFEGAEEDGRLRGTIATSEPLTLDDAQPGWTFTAEVDVEIIDAR